MGTNLEQVRINFAAVPSLKHMASVKIAIALWTGADIKKETFQKRDPRTGTTSYKFYHYTESQILVKVPNFHMPSILEEKISKMITVIGLQLFEWAKSEDLSFVPSILWTMEGLFDKGKTFLKLHPSQPEIQFTFSKIAEFCYKDDLLDLWGQMSTGEKDSFDRPLLSTKYYFHLRLYWICYAKKEMHKLMSFIKPYDVETIYDSNDSVSKNMFQLAIHGGNSYAVKYFWHQLTSEEKGDLLSDPVSLVGCIGEKGIHLMYDLYSFYITSREQEYANTLCFLLSKMNAKEQREVFEQYSGPILKALLFHWPLQNYLIPTITSMWDFLEGKDYVALLDLVTNTIGKLDILMELFQRAPSHLKTSYVRHFIEKPNATDDLVYLIRMGYLEAVQEILRYANRDDQRQMMFSFAEQDWMEIVLKFKISSINKLIEEFLSTECEIKNFKLVIIQKWGNSLLRKWLINDSYQEAEVFLNWVFTCKQEIENYIKETLDKFRIIDDLVYKDQYALMDKFVSWAYSSNLEINNFKQALFKRHLNYFAATKWDEFIKFVNWCYESEENMADLKKSLSNIDVMSPIITRILERSRDEEDFEFAQKFLHWCFNSDEEIRKFKTNHIKPGSEGFSLFEEKLRDPLYFEIRDWKWIKLLAKFYHPLEQNVLNEVKQEMGRVEHSSNYIKLNLRYIFQLLDKYTLKSSSRENNP